MRPYPCTIFWVIKYGVGVAWIFPPKCCRIHSFHTLHRFVRHEFSQTAGSLVCYELHSRLLGGGPRVVVSTAAFHARVRGSVPGLGGLKETKLFLPHPRVKVSIVGSLRDREVACSASDRQGSNFESCVWRTVSSQSSHHPQEVLLAQFSLYVHKGGLKPDSFHFPVAVAPVCLPCYSINGELFIADPGQTQNICITFIQRWTNVEDVGPTL